MKSTVHAVATKFEFSFDEFTTDSFLSFLSGLNAMHIVLLCNNIDNSNLIYTNFENISSETYHPPIINGVWFVKAGKSNHWNKNVRQCKYSHT